MGTLLNRDSFVRSFIDQQYERLKPHLPHILKENYVHRFIELDNHGYVWKDKVYQQLIEEYSIMLSPQEMLNYVVNGFADFNVIANEGTRRWKST
ncbi:hypothetical protein [Lysinibacillus sp. NPDC093692]|uniref:hypothetical protein n=1 Tax=Lysinibacillus sp. NPDC093692 TaxID=3390578 RepID=UPI003D020394